MGKKKYAKKQKLQRENAEFDVLDMCDDIKPTVTAKNEPKLIQGLSKKQRKKAKNRLKMKASVLGDVMMEEVVNNSKQSKTLNQGWHKVTLSNAAKFDKDIVLKSLLSGFNQPFSPVCFMKQNADYSFYIESPKTASALKSFDRKISVTHNFVLKIKVAPSPPPKHFLSDEVKQKMKAVMSNRYRADTKALDLKNFHNDQMFLGDAAYVPLSRSNVMNNALKIIIESVPEIEAIDFSANKLPSLDYFSLLEDAHHLKFIDLSNNRLNDIKELEKLSSLSLKVLDLRNNALVNKFKSREEYVESVRKVLPTLENLDGEVLPKNFTFDKSEPTMPMVKLMSVNDQAKNIMLEFLRQFFSVYDQDDRSALLAAYHPNALFSMSTAYPEGTRSLGANKLTQYQMDARNLNMIVQPSKRLTFLKRGNEFVIKFLNELPPTKHDLNSFTMDIPLANDRIVSVSLSGIFQERNDLVLRHFQRSFVIVPHGTGFLIVNDSLFITNPTVLQAKEAFQSESKAVLPSLSPEMAQNLVKELCSKSRLRPDWAQKCLEENKWNLEVALSVFQEAEKVGKIPPQAYAFTG